MKMCVHFFCVRLERVALAVVVGLEPTILFYQKQQLFLFHEKRKKQFDWNIFLQCIEKKGSCQSKSSSKAATIAWFVNILYLYLGGWLFFAKNNAAAAWFSCLFVTTKIFLSLKKYLYLLSKYIFYASTPCNKELKIVQITSKAKITRSMLCNVVNLL